MGLMDFFIRPEPVSYGTAKGLNTLQINRIAADLRTARDKVNNQMAKRELLEKQREAAVKVKTEAEEQLGVFGLVQILLQKTSDYARQQVKVRIEDIVSEALNVVFGGNHKFMIDLTLRGNQPIAEYYLNDDSVITKLEKPDYDRGGGKIDIIALALRLAVGEMERRYGTVVYRVIRYDNRRHFRESRGVKHERRIIVKGDGTNAFGLSICDNVEDAERLTDRGMPIGNLTSQLLANVYLNELDQFCKKVLGTKFYIRYMDDVIILSQSKEELHEIKERISKFLDEELQLTLNKKTCIRPVSMGIQFVGLHIWSTHRTVRKSTSLRIKRRLKAAAKQYVAGNLTYERYNSTLQSYMGMMKHNDCYRFKMQLLEDVEMIINESGVAA